jgi:outer membrane protein assembly factor BamB
MVSVVLFLSGRLFLSAEEPHSLSVMPDTFLVREMSRRRALSGFAGLTAATLASAAAGCGTARAGAAAPASSRRRPPGTLLWHARAVRGADEPRIVAADGMVYVTGNGQNRGDSGTYAFGSKSGKLAWHIPGPRTFAAGAGAAFGFQVSNSDVTTVVAASAAAGRTRWTHDAGHLLDDAKVGWLSYANGLVYIAAGTTTDNTTGQPTVSALDARTGRRVWRTYTGVPLQEPAVADGRVYVTTTDRVVALNAATGARLWESARVGANVFPMTVVDGVVYGTAFGASPLGGGAAPPAFGLDGATGHELWHANVPGIPVPGTAGIALFESFDIGVTGNGPSTVQARHARSGKLAWKRTVTGGMTAAAAGVVYLGIDPRTLLAVAAATGHTLWSHRLPAPGADVGVAGDTVYVLDANGAVYALQA